MFIRRLVRAAKHPRPGDSRGGRACPARVTRKLRTRFRVTTLRIVVCARRRRRRRRPRPASRVEFDCRCKLKASTLDARHEADTRGEIDR